MNTISRQQNILRYKPQSRDGAAETPLKNNRNLSFGANLQSVAADIASNTTDIITKTITKNATEYSNAQKMIDGIESALGKDYIEDLFNKAKINYSNDKITHNTRTFGGDIERTLRAVINIPLQILTFGLEKFKKQAPEWLNDWNNANAKDKAFQQAVDILEEYARPVIDKNKIDPQKATELFNDTIASNITKVKKNYESRDERTLNRIATATVSALYSGADFYNISMLQKDDKKEAEKAAKNRRHQEFTRMAISAGLTFISLGILDRYTKKNIVLNAAVIAGATLISEVVSRLLRGTSLIPLTPKQAEKKAKKLKNKEENQIQKQDQVSFKSNHLDKEQEAIRALLYKNNNVNAKNNISKQETPAQEAATPETKKQKSKILLYILGAFAAASAFFVALKALKGDFRLTELKRNLRKQLGNDISWDKVKDKIDKADKSAKWSLMENFKKKATKRTVKTDLNDLEKNLKKLTPEGEEPTGAVKIFLDHIEKQKQQGGRMIEQKVDIPVVSAFYAGVTKIFKTIYEVLSAPGWLISKLIHKSIDPNYKETSKFFDDLKRNAEPNYRKELTELAMIFKKNKNNPQKITEIINKRTKNVELGAETGDLANLSRTFVTAISTYFFVNDYRNSVLIESKGKDIEGAKEETKERIAHKCSNYIFNGTLMNIFNTVFKKPLNNNLLAATLIAAATETTNEFLVRKSTCQPIGKKKSKQDIINYEQAQLKKEGLAGWWARTFKKITGKKTLTQKAGIDSKTESSKA